jgi:FkbM family methyltransferase
MQSRIGESVKDVASYLMPDSLKRLLLRGAFSLMSESERDRVRKAFQMASVEWSLRNIRALGFSPTCIVDVGAYVGNWTRMVKSIFANANVLMIEAQPGRQADLQRVCDEYPGQLMYRTSLLGAEARETVEFYELETGSSVLFEQSSITRKQHHYSMYTLDEVLSQAGFGPVDFLKLDVQGYELEVLKGAPQTLVNATVVLMEVSLLGINKGAPLLNEVLQFMAERGFRSYDICSFIRRPLDNALWQSDFLFVKEGTSLLSRESFD